MATATKTKDALSILKADHKKVKQLFDDFEDADDASEKEEIAREACRELKIHAAIEEEMFYPTIRDAMEGDEELVNEAEEEHRVAKTLIEELSQGRQDEHFEAKFKVLAENVKHHIK